MLNFGEIIMKGEYFLGVSFGCKFKLIWGIKRCVCYWILVVIIDLSKSNCVFYILDILEKDVNMLLER